MKNCQITIPSVVYAGQGSSENIRGIIGKEKAQNVLIFADKGVRKLGLSKEIEEICQQEAAVRIIEDLTPEPAVSDIERVIGEVDGQPDLIVAIGGGSVMDAAKLASIIVGADYTLKDLLKDSKIAKKFCKTVMVPTTCGTGSEATCNAIVAIPEQESKQGIVNDCMIPDYVILDVNMIKIGRAHV